MAQPDNIEAMREDLTDLRQQMNDRFAQVDRGFAEMRGKLDAAAAGQQHIVELLNRLITQQNGQ